MAYWLLKSERNCFSIDDLAQSPSMTSCWDGVRNYQARNFMRQMRLGEQAFFYHSGEGPEIVGLVEIVREAYPDHTAFDPHNEHFDPASTVEKPRWDMVDVRLVQRFASALPRTVLAREPELAGMELLRKGSRLSVQPVEEMAFKHILALATQES